MTRYTVRADAPTTGAFEVRSARWWPDALAILARAVRDDHATLAELRTFPDGRLIARHDATGYDFTPDERSGACHARYRRILDEAVMICRRPAGHPGYCRADGGTSDEG